MDNETIRVGLIGAGRNTRNRHIPGLQAIASVEIVGVANRSRVSSEAVAKEFGFPKVYDHWQQLIDDPQIDAVVIGTWPYMHRTMTLAALAADKHVLCEARMAMDATEARAMRDAAQAKPALVTQIVPSPFTLRVDGMVKKLLAEEYLGQILAVEVRDGGQFLDREGLLHWRNDFNLSGYNAMSLGIWFEALMYWIGGVTQVVAMGQTYVKMRKDDDGVLHAVRIPEHLDVIATMECGAQAHYQVSSVTGLADGLGIYLFGSEGTLYTTSWNAPDGQKLYGGRRGDTTLKEIAVPPELEGGWRVEEEFIGAIRGQEAITHTTFDDGVKYMEFTEAVARSVATGRAISLPL